MRFVKTGKVAKQKTRNQLLYRKNSKWIVVFGLTLAYILIFQAFVDRIGPMVSIFLLLPITAIGIYFGRNTGVVASLIGFALNLLLLTRFDFNTSAQVTHYWPGYLAILIIGYYAGYFHDESVARKHISNEIVSRERFVALMNIATRYILDTKDPDEAYYRLISHLTNLFVADYAYLIQWDETKKQASLIAATIPLEPPLSPVVLEPEETSIIMSAIQTGQPQIIENVQGSDFIINPSRFKELALQTKSAFVLPIVMKDFRFGAVILAFEALHSFSKEENMYIELASSQISLVLRTIRQQLEIEAQLKEAKALANIERALSESERVGVDKVLQLIVDSAIELIPKASNVILHLMDEKKQILEPRAVAGFTETTKEKLNMRPGEGIAGQVMAERKVIRIADVRNDHRFLDQSMPVKFRSLVVAPIKSHEECIGTISIHSNVANAFNDNEVNLLETLGIQVSIGIDNANLLETLERRVQQRTHDLIVLYNLITIISENWNLQDILELSLMLTLETVNADRGIIYLIDGKIPPTLKPVIQRGFADGFRIQADKLPDDELARRVFIQHKPLSLENLADTPTYERFNELNSYAGIPILVRGEVRGVFSLFAKEKDVFEADEMALLSSIADHLGIGIDNSILWDQSRESAALEERNRLARNLHDSVSQLLYSLTLMAGSTKKMLERDHDLEAVKKSVSRLGDTAQQALKEMRLLLYELRPAVLDSEGLVSALQHRIGTVEDRLGVKVDLQAQGLPNLPSDMEDALYHIALEALNNIVKHSGSTKASIKFFSKRDNVVMEISDEGIGFDTDQHHSGQGLRNMRERVQMLGGEVEIESSSGHGTHITVKMKNPSLSLIES